MALRPDVVTLKAKQKEQENTPREIEKQHALGKLTARERIDLLVDPGSFSEFDSFMEGMPLRWEKEKIQTRQCVITGTGRVHGRQVYLYAQDFTVEGGSVGEGESRKICKIMDMAMQSGKPMIGLNTLFLHDCGVDRLSIFGRSLPGDRAGVPARHHRSESLGRSRLASASSWSLVSLSIRTERVVVICSRA